MCERCKHDMRAAKECFIDHEMRLMAKKSNKKLTHQETNEIKSNLEKTFKYTRDKKCMGCLILAEETVELVRQNEMLDKSENKRLARKGKTPHPTHNAPKRRREADDSDPDSDHDLAHFHDPLDPLEAKHHKVEIITERRN